MRHAIKAAACGLALWGAAGAASATDLYPIFVDNVAMNLLDKDSIKRDGAIVTAVVVDIWAKPQTLAGPGSAMVGDIENLYRFDCAAPMRRQDGGSILRSPSGEELGRLNGDDKWVEFDYPAWRPVLCEGAAPPVTTRYPDAQAARAGYMEWLRDYRAAKEN